MAIPHELDALVLAAAAEYVAADVPTRTKIRESIARRAAGVLCVFGERQAAVAVRLGAVDPLRIGLVSMGMGHERLDDYRDSLMVLATVNDAGTIRPTSGSTL